jgi:hypothetical protein
VNPNSLLAKKIPKSDDIYEGTLKDCAYTELILQELGFKDEEFCYVLYSPDIAKAQQVEVELGEIIEHELPLTSVFLSIKEVQSKNEISDVIRVLRLLSKSFQNVLSDPHASKFHRLLLRKLLGKQLKGGLRLLSVLELKVNIETETVEFPYPFRRGVIRLERISALLEMSIQKLGLKSQSIELASFD